MKKLFQQTILNLKYFLASLQRRRLNHVTFIGITGSAGKTTAKDLIASLLANYGPCRKTYLSYGTLESNCGTIWYTNKTHRYCIVEVAAYGPGTMDWSINLLKPDIAVITRIGRDHYSAYKNMEALVAEKEKLVLALSPGGIAVLNKDDPLVRAIGERCNRRVLWFGETEGATLRLLEARSRWPEPLIVVFEYDGKTYEVRTHLHGEHLAISVLATLGVALAARLPLEAAIATLAQAPPTEGRMQTVTDPDGVVFIRDDMKAPGWSLHSPLEFLKNAEADRKIAVVGTISDESRADKKKYKKYGRLIREYVDLVVFVGPHAHHAQPPGQIENDSAIRCFPNIRHATTYLQKELKKGDLVLLKGSNKADHLVRLMINRNRPIRCWKDQCAVEVFCDQCSELYKPSRHISFAEPMAMQAGPAIPVVVGLGNPGIFYRRTLHNVGYRVLDSLAQATESVWQIQPEGWVCLMVIGETTIHLLKPRTDMNNSGVMVRRFLERIRSDPRRCTIVHDDADLVFGDVRLKNSGGDAGHRGVRSVIMALGTVNIQRVRLGVRRSGDVNKSGKFVLTRISTGEKAMMDQMIDSASAKIMERLRYASGVNPTCNKELFA
jgi:aminoacyl-tRNA hydrolase